MPGIEVRRAADRFVTTESWLTTRHSFSFGAHYDPNNVGFGSLVVHDEHTVAPGNGFDRHPHRGLDIVSWVLDGELTHEDAAGERAVVAPGTIAYQRAGSGIEHVERNAGTVPLRFVQMWLLADGSAPPDYRLVRVPDGPGGTVALRLPAATLHVVRLDGGSVAVPGGELVHVFVARGAVTLAGYPLGASDAVRITGARAITVAGRGELLVWTMPAA